MMPMVPTLQTVMPSAPNSRPAAPAAAADCASAAQAGRGAQPSGGSFKDALQAANSASSSRPDAPPTENESTPDAAADAASKPRGGLRAAKRASKPTPASDAAGAAEAACDASAAESSTGADPSPTAELAALLQSLAGTPDQQAASAAVVEPAAESEGTDGDDKAALLQLIDELQAAQKAAGSESGATNGLAQLLDQLKTIAAQADASQAALPGQIHQMLRDLHQHLSGIAWGQAMKEAAPGVLDASTAAVNDSGSVASGTGGVSITGDAAAAQAPAAAAPELPVRAAIAALTRTPAGWQPAPEADPNATQDQKAGKPAPPATAAVRAAEPVRPVGPQNGVASESAQATPSDRGAATMTTGDRGRDELKSETKPLSGDALPLTETPADANSPETAPADARLLRLHDTRPEHPADATATAARDKEAAGVSRSSVYDQIVQKAVVQVKNEQSEIKIDLKPEFLGNVRMQIVTENQQVSVRILTEAPAVRDLIETGLQQLRSELQNQGLHVDRLEVSVSEDYREPRRQQGRAGDRQQSGRVASVDGSERSSAGDRIEPAYFRSSSSSRRSTVDMFV